MELQSACGWVHNQLSSPVISPFHPRKAPLLDSAPKKHLNASVALSKQTLLLQDERKLKSRFRSRTVLCALNSEQPRTSTSPGREPRDVRLNAIDGSEPFRGKPGSVSFLGQTHQSVEESKLVSAPVEENVGSFVWVLAPVALISSLVLPRFFLGNAVEDLFRDELLSEIISSFASEVMFYIGLATFLRVTDHVQKPYLQFSPKRWSLITGLRGYLTSVFFIMGFKIFAPLLAVYVTWPVLGLPALVSVAPFLAGCLVQFLFEKRLESRESSSWPLVTIIFEVYRIYQLTRAVQFIQTFMFAMKDAPITQQLLERNDRLQRTIEVCGGFVIISLYPALVLASRVLYGSSRKLLSIRALGFVPLPFLSQLRRLAFLIKTTPWKLHMQMFLEKVIMDCRFFAMFAVGGSLLGSGLCFVEGFSLILESYFEYFHSLSQGSEQEHLVHLLIEAIDMFLVAIAMLLFGMEMHVMFVGSSGLPGKLSQLLHISTSIKAVPSRVGIHTIMQAKSKIGQAVIMILQVGVLEKFKTIPLVTGFDLACFAGAVFTSSACMFLLSKLSGSGSGALKR